MNIINDAEILLPGLYLVTAGLIGACGISRRQLGILVPILAIVTGIVIYIDN